MTPDVLSLPGYLQVTILSFWLPTLGFALLTWFVYRRDAHTRGTWVEKGAWLAIGVAVAIELAGWVFNAPWLHLLAPRIAVGALIACAIWSCVLLLTRRNAGSDRQ